MSRFNISIIILSFLIFLCGCERLYEDSFVLCNTFVRIKSFYPQAAKIAYQEIKRLEKIFNFYDPYSEISKLNSSYSTPFKVSRELMEVIKIAKKLYQLTGGYFDISKGRLYDFWKKMIKKKEMNFENIQNSIDEFRKDSIEDIICDEASSTVLIRRKGLKIDLGGIAKGYMVDKVVEKFAKAGITSALVDIGGDIFCLGKHKGRNWNVGIKNPFAGGIIKRIFLSNRAVATSGSYEQFLIYKDKLYSHIVNPFLGFPQDTEIVSVTVVASSCVLADALATSFFIMGEDRIKKFLHQHSNFDIKVFTINRDGKVHLF